jgi:hypothetical protein
MADIMISCPTFGKAIPTGITTDAIVLHTLDFPLTTHCPACRKIHKWTREDAWVNQPNRKAAGWGYTA